MFRVQLILFCKLTGFLEPVELSSERKTLKEKTKYDNDLPCSATHGSEYNAL